jgi:hypothetical protein
MSLGFSWCVRRNYTQLRRPFQVFRIIIIIIIYEYDLIAVFFLPRMYTGLAPVLAYTGVQEKEAIRT